MPDLHYFMLLQVDQTKSIEAWHRERRNLRYLDQASNLSGRVVLTTVASAALVLAGIGVLFG
jgi:hypothetical protein